jgi:hypothetical protein
LCASVSTTDSTNIRGYYDRLHHTAVEPFSFIYRTTGGVCRRVAKSNETSEGTELPYGDRNPQAAERTHRESGELCFGIFVPQELRERVFDGA